MQGLKNDLNDGELIEDPSAYSYFLKLLTKEATFY